MGHIGMETAVMDVLWEAGNAVGAGMAAGVAGVVEVVEVSMNLVEKTVAIVGVETVVAVAEQVESKVWTDVHSKNQTHVSRQLSKH